jgi:hypothetical protein
MAGASASVARVNAHADVVSLARRRAQLNKEFMEHANAAGCGKRTTRPVQWMPIKRRSEQISSTVFGTVAM